MNEADIKKVIASARSVTETPVIRDAKPEQIKSLRQIIKALVSLEKKHGNIPVSVLLPQDDDMETCHPVVKISLADFGDHNEIEIFIANRYAEDVV